MRKAKNREMSAGRLMISAAGSGFGKSVVTMGLLQALKERGCALQSFKCGPDYIDPGFHERVLGTACRNLDTWLMGREEVLNEVSDAVFSGRLAVAEGAMGLFDGLGGGMEHSAYSIAAVCGMSVLVVLDAGRDKGCVEQLKELLERDTEQIIGGFLINRCHENEYLRIFRELQNAFPVYTLRDRIRAVDRQMKKSSRMITACGFLPPIPEAMLSSRHLGLKGAQEIKDFARRTHIIADELERAGCVDAALSIMQAPSSKEGVRIPIPRSGDRTRCRIAVARDEAFSFLYQRSLENLERAGAKLCFFSPLHDSTLPDAADGLYLPGGYPELYAHNLEKNAPMRRAVREAVLGGLPTVAECGGFLYLGERLNSEDGQSYQMAGALPGRAERKEKLVRFGYLELTQEKGDSLLFREGESVTAHEFHYWDSDRCGEDLLAGKRSKNRTWRCGYVRENLYAAFPHLYMNEVRAERFVEACAKYQKEGRLWPGTS